MTNQEKLKNIWKLSYDCNKYVADCDTKCLKKNDEFDLQLSYFYRTHVLPLPFMGKINEPNVLILALNPSYDPMNDEKDTFQVRNYNKKNSIDYIDNLFEFDLINNNDERNVNIIGEYTYSWWRKVFDNAKPKINSEIGIFNLCGYHSTSYKTIPCKCLEKGKYLQSQIDTCKIIYDIICNPKTELVIIVWGQKEWEKYFKSILKIQDINLNKLNKVVVLNDKNNFLNKSIYKYYNNLNPNDSKKDLLKKFFEL